MATVVGAVGVGVTRFAALVAVGNNLPVYAFAQPFVEHKIFADKFRLEVGRFDLAGIFQHAAMQLVHVFKSLVFQVGAGFFAADSASAIQQYFFIFFVL